MKAFKVMLDGKEIDKVDSRIIIIKERRKSQEVSK